MANKRITFVSMNLPDGYLLQKGKYKLANVVGQGGFGITYKGIWYTEVKGSLGTIQTDVPVCIKEYFFKDYCYRDTSNKVQVHSETGRNLFHKFKEKLLKEARILSAVHHPYIVNVLEVFEENNTAYIAMEYISGLSLKQLMERNGLMPEAKVLRYVRQIGEALQFVHENNIVHLDIKPSNIIVDKHDNARLIDFGVSKQYDDDHHETSTTMMTLSKGYASIEQYDNKGTQIFSPRPDVYSLGATMYNLLTGKIPTESILRATRPLIEPIELNPHISPKTNAVIIKAMQVVPTDRFDSIGEMMEALELPAIEKSVAAERKISDENISEEGDTTVIYPQIKGKKVFNLEDEQTEVQTPPLLPKRKKRKGSIIAAFIGFAIVASAVTLFWYNQRTIIETTEFVNPIQEETNNNEEHPLNGQQDIETLTTPATNASDIQQSTLSEQSVSVPNNAIVSQIEENTIPTITEEGLPPINADTEYVAFLESGKKKMSEGDFMGAEHDFTSATEFKATEEVLALLFEAKEKAKEKAINEKRSLYEEKMTFGDLTIVRKIVTQKYGAIDKEANERIPCKYLMSRRSENNRAFEREDNLFDIYNEEGMLISGGVTSY
ncbi:serine/threonine-protein kinase [Parabacteroides sp. PF5-9]|uniref:serine/threonine-protein kinase n=1 Tax=Parabacteroides sp. PF5-9 TaxID=1742404 RepID=UPI0024755BE9|nr:serine/threonine-protein kinase [Parabacteroides sp. PF5-9]MDH6356462.1 Kae1-associated kinase Bud32 [Parabacteroides sp. PF5-9]